MLVPIVSKVFTKVFGSRNDRLLKGYHRRVQQINALADGAAKLSDAELKAKTAEFRQRMVGGETIAAVAIEALAVAREVMDRAVGIRNILNPDSGFDPGTLPPDVQPLYEQAQASAQATAPQEVLGSHEPVPGWIQSPIPVELYDAVRKLYPQSRPPFRARPFDVQLIGGLVLWEGKIAEMRTGEGKTIVAPLACYLACLQGLQCHVVTVNDYLVQRDRDWVFPFYYHLGLTVGAIHPIHMQPPEAKKRAYECDVVYGTNSEFGFDYLRDNMKLSPAEQVQKHRDFAIYDEVDSILIDEARTPLIISGPAHEDSPRYGLADQIARHLMQKQRAWDAADDTVRRAKMRIKGLEGDIRNTRDKSKIPAWRQEMKGLEDDLPRLEAQRDAVTRYYELEMEKKASHLTHDGIAEAQKLANIGSFYVGSNMDFPHLLEQALRAHVVYQRDKDYVVQNDEVIIVDEFTGRLMIGRQWSDGLHQAVEAKEKVRVKEETQTLATITIQNYAKLYARLAGMTGTAITEATEFNDIYDLDVVCIPTNRPMIRVDRDDLVYLSEKDKWNAILDEIHHHYRLGRPVLVGTTSVENSEMLSAMLTKRHGIKHAVLNARVDKAEEESLIVAHAGELGAVMIATNMAGRGTDIKLAPIDRAALVHHWQLTNLLPKEAKAEMPDEQLIDLSYRHQAVTTLGLSEKQAAGLGEAELRLRLLRHWVAEETFVDPEKAGQMSEPQCLRELDKLADFMLHRLRIYQHVEEMGGLHIVGTERHEARRIDNQLRGRSGRQGDQGSSRFFIALEDDLMKLFAGKTTLTALSKLGMKEGDAIEHRWITKSVERAQKKVEERNFEIRKNLLEYDEVMEYQRRTFYGIRQAVLEGRDIPPIIFGYIGDAVQDAVAMYLADDYVPTQLAEWCRQTLDVSIEPGKLGGADLEPLQAQVRSEAQAEARSVIDVTLGEYMSSDMPPEEWDLRGLSSWAMSRFSADLTQTRLRKMSIDEVKAVLIEAATEQIEKKDLAGLAKFLEPHYGQRQLADWAQNKFGLKPDVQALAKLQPPEVAQFILEQARAAYHRREVAYPVEFAMEMTVQAAQQNPAAAAEQLARWANFRFQLGWKAQDVTALGPQQTYDKLLAAAQEWDKSRLEATVDAALAENDTDTQKLAAWATEHFGVQTKPEEFADGQTRREVLLAKGRTMLRGELTQLERFVLLQILDVAWKDHLYAMDQLKDSVGLRGYAERDPRIEYKREGANQFNQMQVNVRDRVTDLIFRARLTPNVQVRSVYQQQDAQHAQARGALDAAAAAASQRGTAQQQADLQAAEQANRSEQQHFASRKQRRAAAAREAKENKHERQFKERKRRSR